MYCLVRSYGVERSTPAKSQPARSYNIKRSSNALPESYPPPPTRSFPPPPPASPRCSKPSLAQPTTSTSMTSHFIVVLLTPRQEVAAETEHRVGHARGLIAIIE